MILLASVLLCPLGQRLKYIALEENVSILPNKEENWALWYVQVPIK